MFFLKKPFGVLGGLPEMMVWRSSRFAGLDGCQTGLLAGLDGLAETMALGEMRGQKRREKRIVGLGLSAVVFRFVESGGAGRWGAGKWFGNTSRGLTHGFEKAVKLCSHIGSLITRSGAGITRSRACPWKSSGGTIWMAAGELYGCCGSLSLRAKACAVAKEMRPGLVDADWIPTEAKGRRFACCGGAKERGSVLLAACGPQGSGGVLWRRWKESSPGALA